MYKSLFFVLSIYCLFPSLNAQKGDLIAFHKSDNLERQLENASSKRSANPSKHFAQLSFPGGNEALGKFIVENLVYPEVARENSIEGTVLVKAYFDATGKLSSASVQHSLFKACDEAVIEVLSRMPDWIPAKINGKPVERSILLPVVFKLNRQN
jgi:TonB family protein